MWNKLETPYYNIEIIPLENQRMKLFKYGNRNIRVYCHLSKDGTYTVSAGADSELSHTGCFYPQEFNNIDDICNAIDERDKKGKLIY